MTSGHAFVISGTQSGCGKTTLTLGLIAAIRRRGLRVQPFKVGPDFIDPGLHGRAAGVESRNLDGWMLGPDYNRSLFRRLARQADAAVVEGVMGLFDGYDGLSEAGSSAEMAKQLGLPVLLVVDARSMARSAAALVHGFSSFDPAVRIAGVIFNRIGGEGHLEYLREAMTANLPDIPVLGGIPREDCIRIPERHLGLVTADEFHLSAEWLETLANLIERYVNLDLLLESTVADRESFEPPPAPAGPPPASPGRIAVARDAAFCFYYPDNFEWLQRAGASLHFFSPLSGENLPEDCSGLYLGGGYPELFAEALSGRKAFLESIRNGAALGLPIYAECGGLMVLGRFIETIEGNRFPMASVLPFGTRMLPRRKALGYTEVVLRRACLLGDKGLRLRGHEFHYSEIVESTEDPGLETVYEIKGRKMRDARPEGYSAGSVLGSYIHLHWGSAPEAAAAFAGHCAGYFNRRNRRDADSRAHPQQGQDRHE